MENTSEIYISEKYLVKYLKKRWGIEEEIIPQTIKLLITQGKIFFLPAGNIAVLIKK